MQLRDFATAVRLPANMDLFLVGSLEPAEVQSLVEEHFGEYQVRKPRSHSVASQSMKPIITQAAFVPRLKLARNDGVSPAKMRQTT